jgi:hypothetical protein
MLIPKWSSENRRLTMRQDSQTQPFAEPEFALERFPPIHLSRANKLRPIQFWTTPEDYFLRT